MTDEGMRLLRELRDYLETAAAVAQHAGLGIIAKAHTHMKNRIVSYLSSRPEPQGETPLTDAADDPTMRFSARHERLKDLCKFLERRLREAEEMLQQMTIVAREQRKRAEAAERKLQGPVGAFDDDF